MSELVFSKPVEILLVEDNSPGITPRGSILDKCG